jgi:transcriptional regulator with XRE-family HTH domain
MTLGSRLKQERLRLGLTQAKLASLGRLAPGALLNYERGTRLPRADFLAALSLTGVDVLYVVTGVRIVDAVSQMTPNEQDLVRHMKPLRQADKHAIVNIVRSLAFGRITVSLLH